MWYLHLWFAKFAFIVDNVSIDFSNSIFPITNFSKSSKFRMSYFFIPIFRWPIFPITLFSHRSFFRISNILKKSYVIFRLQFSKDLFSRLGKVRLWSVSGMTSTTSSVAYLRTTRIINRPVTHKSRAKPSLTKPSQAVRIFQCIHTEANSHKADFLALYMTYS